jgi:hypothetical protein
MENDFIYLGYNDSDIGYFDDYYLEDVKIPDNKEDLFYLEYSDSGLGKSDIGNNGGLE